MNGLDTLVTPAHQMPKPKPKNPSMEDFREWLATSHRSDLRHQSEIWEDHVGQCGLIHAFMEYLLCFYDNPSENHS